jgi:hypothetical protein
MRTYVGIDLHARTLQLCVVDAEKGERILERARVPNRLPAILELLAPYRADTSVAVESTFTGTGWWTRCRMRATRSTSSTQGPRSGACPTTIS